MVANVNGPQFSGGANIAIKCPAHTYEQTVAFYRDMLGTELNDAALGVFNDSVRSATGDTGAGTARGSI